MFKILPIDGELIISGSICSLVDRRLIFIVEHENIRRTFLWP